MAKLGFNANDVAPSSGGGPLPPGEYEFQVIEESLDTNAAGTGEVLKLTYEVLGPDMVGRQVWINMNISHSNPIAQKIGQEELSALCHATGQMQVDDTEELLWKPFRAITKIETSKSDGKERAVIKKYLFGDALSAPAEKPRPTPPSRPTASAAQTARPAAGTRPTAGARPTAAAAGGRSLPWQGRQSGGAQAAIDDEIPF